MNINPTWLLLSLVISAVGMGLFIYGKKQSRVPHLVAGLILMIYTYVVTSALWMILIALAILAALFMLVRLGW